MNPTKSNHKFKIGDKITLKHSQVDTTHGKVYEIHHIHPSGGQRPYCFVDDAGDDNYFSEDEANLITSNNIVEDTILSKISEYHYKIRNLDSERDQIIKDIQKLTDALEILTKK